MMRAREKRMMKTIQIIGIAGDVLLGESEFEDGVDNAD